MKEEQHTTPKKIYVSPSLRCIGKINKITLKTGSQTDFGTGRFTA